jgi:hypothetical protein
MLNSSERQISPSLTRRRFLQVGTAATGAFLVSGLVPNSVEAGASPIQYYSLPDWYPHIPTAALISLHAPNGPLADFDSAFNTRVREVFEAEAHWALHESPEAKAIEAKQRVNDRNTWGWCHAAAEADRAVGRLYHEGKISWDQLQGVYKDRKKRAVLAAYWAGQVQVRPHWEATKTPENNRIFLDRLNNTGEDFIGDYDIGLPGSWFHNTKDYDPVSRAVLIGGFGKPDRWISENNLRVSFEPEELDVSVAIGRDPRMLKENQSVRTSELTKARVHEYIFEG